MEDMNMTENARIILALRAEGWSDTKINNLILYIETGNNNFLEDMKKSE